MTGSLIFEIVDDHIALLKLNRPRVRNAIDDETSLALAEAVDRIEADPQLRVVVLASSTAGIFCAGADLNVVAAGRAGALIIDGKGFAGVAYAERTKPWIVAVDGPAYGGGFEICLGCDMIVASRRAAFALPEVKRGLIAGGGGVNRAARVLPINVALELVSTGAPLSGERAERLGMVNRLTEPGEELPAALDLARAIAANAPIAVRESLAVVRKTGDIDEKTMRQYARERLHIVMTSADAAEGPRAFLEKRAPVWTGR